MSQEQGNTLTERQGRTGHDRGSDYEEPEAPSGEREVSIRDLRNAGRVLEELAKAGETGRVTSGGKLVGWVVPASLEQRRREELIALGKLRPGKPGGLAGRKPLARRTDMPSLSETLREMQDEETR